MKKDYAMLPKTKSKIAQCRSDHKGHICIDCGRCTMHMPGNKGMEYYMVTDEVWDKAGMHPDGVMLCIADLEQRLGRELNRYDFTDCPLNQSVKLGGWNATARLVERINRNTKLVKTI